MRVLLLASVGDESEKIADFCRKAFDEVDAYHGNWNDPMPEACGFWRGDLIVSYCSRWIVPASLLNSASLAAINFHPGPPEHPGVGGLNWALYGEEKTFGVTCHHMSPKIDDGPIIAVRRFPLFPSDKVESVFARTHAMLQVLAYDVLAMIAAGEPVPKSTLAWSGKYRTRKELNDLCEIAADMSLEEVSRRVRATAFGFWRPTIQIGDHIFKLDTPPLPKPSRR